MAARTNQYFCSISESIPVKLEENSMKHYILALDQGTTSSRSILFDNKGTIVTKAQKDFEQLFPKSGWVEHDPLAIWESQLETIHTVLNHDGISANNIAAIGITNQRETVILWDKRSGKPISNAIVWQDRRTAEFCDQLVENGYSELIKEKTGLVIDAYFSASKIKWLLDHIEGAREKANNNELCFGTVDSWLIYKLTEGDLHITDVTNASRTMLYNIHDLCWDQELLEIFNIPGNILPSVKESSALYGHSHPSLFGTSIPIAGIAGDQQAALFGQLCAEKGMAKNTYGTGCFLLMNTGSEAVTSSHNLLTTIAWSIKGNVTYAMEGSVFVGGAAVQWIRDGMQLIEDAEEIESLAQTVDDNGGVVFVPALTGLGAPYWDPYARGAFYGLSRGTKKGHIARATLEGIAFQVYDIMKAMEEDAGQKCIELRVDGGASANNFLLQFQSDIFEFQIVRPKLLETTALGAAYLAGLAVGFWESIDALQSQWQKEKIFKPILDHEAVSSKIKIWEKAVSRSLNWAKD